MAKKVNQIINVYEADIKKYQKQLEAVEKQNKELAGQIDKVKKEVKGVDKAGSKLGGTLKKVGAQFAAAFAAQQLIRDAIKTISDFQQENARLASILGKTRQQITALSNDAKRLGASTAFTANEVSKLQTEFAKLGFSEREILQVTEATLQLAAATQSDLSQAASIAGATVRGFGLDASETQRVVDVMAKSFSSSALDLGKFEVAMRTVAPVADSAGVSIEQTTALLGVLADRGLDASTAGTSLRNIFLELSAKGLTFDEAMQKINESTDRNATALDLFGKRGSTAANIIAGAAGDVANLNEKLEQAAGTAETMANEQLNTLTGSITILKSAWDGLILSLEDGEGILGRAAKGLIDLTTGALSTATAMNETNNWLALVNPSWASFIQLQAESERAIEQAKNQLEEENAELDKQNDLLDDNAEATGTTLESLKKQQAELRQELERLPIGSPEFIATMNEYKGVTDQIKDATAGMKDEVVKATKEAKSLLEVFGDIANEVDQGMFGDFEEGGVRVYPDKSLRRDTERIDEFLDQSNEATKKAADENVKNAEENQKKLEEAAQSKEDLEEEIRRQGVQLAAQAASRIVEINRAKNQQEYDQEMQRLQAQLAAEEITQKEFEELGADALRKKNEQNKKSAIFQSLIDVAQATLSGLITGGPVLAAVYGGLAAAQAAIIQSLEIPAYAEGVIGLQGPGTETSDSIIARLSKGESVMKAKTTKKHKSLLTAMHEDNDKRINDVLMSDYILGNKELLSGLAFSQGRNDFSDKGIINTLLTEGRAGRKEQRKGTERLASELRKSRTKNRKWYG